MGRESYIKVYRKMLDNPVVTKDPEHFTLWIHLLLKANFRPREEMFGGKVITTMPGQFTTGRKQISMAIKVNESRVERILKEFERENLIEQQTSSRNRLISIVCWDKYQQSEQQANNQNRENELEQSYKTPKIEQQTEQLNEQQIEQPNGQQVNNCKGVIPTGEHRTANQIEQPIKQQTEQPSGQPNEQQANNKRTTSEQRANTLKECKECKNVKNERKDIYYGEFENVRLTSREFEKLVERFPQTYREWIDRLSAYIASTGKRYKNHYATILNWERKDRQNGKSKLQGRNDWIDDI